MFSDTSILAFTVRSIPGIVHCRDFPFRRKYELYKKFGVDMFAFACILWFYTSCRILNLLDRSQHCLRPGLQFI